MKHKIIFGMVCLLLCTSCFLLPKQSALNSDQDTDNDGIVDRNDVCPTVAGPAEFQGCPDTDGDGVADKDDACPDTAGMLSMMGCADSDGDGVPDNADACPDAAGDRSNRGCPYADSDGDGVLDKDDKCPDVKGTTGNAGCPESTDMITAPGNGSGNNGKSPDTAPIPKKHNGHVKTPTTPDSFGSSGGNGDVAISPRIKGNLIYYCPERMDEKSTYIISVLITKEELAAARKALSASIDSDYKDIERTEHDMLDRINIDISKKMKCVLTYNKDEFDVVNPPSAELIFDGEDLRWNWTVTPKVVNKLELTLSIQGFDELKGQWLEAGRPIIMHTSVQVDPRNFLERLWAFFQKEPQWLFTQVFFPVIAYYVGRRNARKDRREKGKEGADLPPASA